jgi:predicted adenylyl cyclase CyaB
LELKIACDEAQQREIAARALIRPGSDVDVLQQTDTYFVVPHGRLKVREIVSRTTGEHVFQLIAYQRPDRSASRWSDYRVIALSVETGRELLLALSASCGVLTTVGKRRTVAIWGRTRIHLDDVASLGCFVELETVAQPHDRDDDVKEEHETVIDRLGLRNLPVISGSYSDLVLERYDIGQSDERQKEQHA